MFDCNLFFPLICFKDYRNSKLARILSCVLAHALFTTQLKPNYRCFLNLLLRVSVSFREFKKTTTPLGTGTSLNKRFNEQNNSCARALLLFVHFFAVLCKTTGSFSIRELKH